MNVPLMEPSLVYKKRLELYYNFLLVFILTYTRHTNTLEPLPYVSIISRNILFAQVKTGSFFTGRSLLSFLGYVYQSALDCSTLILY